MDKDVRQIVTDCVDFLYTLDFSGNGCRQDELPSEEFLQVLARGCGVNRFYAARFFNPVYQIFREHFASQKGYPSNPFPFNPDDPETQVHYWKLRKKLPERETFVGLVLEDYETYLLANLESARKETAKTKQPAAV